MSRRAGQVAEGGCQDDFLVDYSLGNAIGQRRSQRTLVSYRDHSPSCCSFLDVVSAWNFNLETETPGISSTFRVANGDYCIQDLSTPFVYCRLKAQSFKAVIRKPLCALAHFLERRLDTAETQAQSSPRPPRGHDRRSLPALIHDRISGFSRNWVRGSRDETPL